VALVDNLVSYWNLDEASGTRVDSHGSNDLADNNTVTSATGIDGDAAHFVAASSEHLSIADNASLGFTTALSASFWLKQTDLAISRAFLGKWTFQTDGEWVIQSGFQAGNEGDLTIFLATSAADSGTGCRMNFTDADMTAGNWFHVAVVFDGSLTGNANRLKVWVNGAAKTLTANSGAVPATLINGGATFYLGRFGGSLTRYYNGDMDLVGLWNRAITSAEVTSLYNGGAGLNYAEVNPIPAQANPGRAAAAVGHGQLGLASGLRTFRDLMGSNS
jgi:hypothetical protein